MNETDQLRVVCPNCGKRLRVKAALDGKRLKCPACSNLFQVNAHPNEDEGEEQPESKVFPWLLVGVGSGALLLVALALLLWVGARSEVAWLKAQIAESRDKAAKTNEAIEDLRKQLELAKKSLGTAITDIEDLKKKLDAEKEVTLRPVSPDPQGNQEGHGKQAAVPAAEQTLAGQTPSGETPTGETDQSPAGQTPEPPPTAEKLLWEKKMLGREGVHFLLPIEALGDRKRLARIKVVQTECRATSSMGLWSSDVIFTWHSPTMCKYVERRSEQAFPGVPFPGKGPPSAGELPPFGPPPFGPPPFGSPPFGPPPGLAGQAGPSEKSFLVRGDTGYVKMGSKVQVLTGRALEDTKNEVFSLGLSNLHSLNDYDVTFVKTTQVKGRPHFILKLSKEGQRDVQLYFDKDSKLLTKAELPGPVLREIYFSDYRETDGVKHWHRAEQCHNGVSYAQLEVLRVRFFYTLDEALFAPPGKDHTPAAVPPQQKQVTP